MYSWRWRLDQSFARGRARRDDNSKHAHAWVTAFRKPANLSAPWPGFLERLWYVAPAFLDATMPIPVSCPTCGAKLKAPDKMVGRKTNCPKCGTAVVVPSPYQEALEPTCTDALPQPVKRAELPAVRPKPPFEPVEMVAEDDFDLVLQRCVDLARFR